MSASGSESILALFDLGVGSSVLRFLPLPLGAGVGVSVLALTDNRV
jgi:hypothetical protein